MQHVSGIVTVVQEARFRLVTDDGRSILFTLDRSASTEPQDLPDLLDGRRVEVVYRTPARRKALVAQHVRVEGRG